MASVSFVNLGVDLGQRRDPTAVAVVEMQWRPGGPSGREESHYVARFLERLPLGTLYPAVVKRVGEIATNLTQRLRQEAADRFPEPFEPADLGTLYLDATGALPALDMFQAADLPLPVRGCVFNHGDRRVRGGREIVIGKAWLVNRLQVLLQSGRLHLPKTAEAQQAGKELLDYEIHVDQNANDTYGAFKVGTHDDLVTALGLACQEDDSDMMRPLDDDLVADYLGYLNA